MGKQKFILGLSVDEEEMMKFMEFIHKYEQ